MFYFEMWYGETGRGKASLMPRPHPTPYQLPCSQHLCCLGLASGSAGSVLRLDPAYLLPAALSPSANWLVAWWQLCTQSPGGERVEQTLPLAPGVTLGRSLPSLGISVSIPQPKGLGPQCPGDAW